MSVDALLAMVKEMKALRPIATPPVIRVGRDVTRRASVESREFPGLPAGDRLFGFPIIRAADGEHYAVTRPDLMDLKITEPITLGTFAGSAVADGEVFARFRSDLINDICSRFAMPPMLVSDDLGDGSTRAMTPGDMQNPAPQNDAGELP